MSASSQTVHEAYYCKIVLNIPKHERGGDIINEISGPQKCQFLTNFEKISQNFVKNDASQK